jgi:hypothetical protein
MFDRSEWRQSARYVITLPLLLKSDGFAPARVVVGWTRNLSEGGSCVDLPERLRPRTPLTVHLQADHDIVEGEAQVVWTGEPAPAGEGIRHGLAFTRISPEQNQTLKAVLRSRGEKRQAGMRVPYEVPVTCQPKGRAESPVQGRTDNMSRGGILLRVPAVFPPEKVLELTLHTSYGPLAAEGAVVWVEPEERRIPGKPIRHGMRFIVLG